MRKKTALERINELERELEKSNFRLNSLNVQYEKLLNDYRVCYTALESSQKRIKELAEGQAAVAAENNTLKSNNARLCEENEKLRQEKGEAVAALVVSAAPAAAETKEDIPSYYPKKQDNVAATNATKPKISLSEIEKYGSSVIGSVVVEATRIIGTLAGKTTPNAKDTLSLVLGRTEVLKSEVLAIVRDETLTDDVKKECIEKSKEQAMEYLASVEAQE